MDEKVARKFQDVEEEAIWLAGCHWSSSGGEGKAR